MINITVTIKITDPYWFVRSLLICYLFFRLKRFLTSLIRLIVIVLFSFLGKHLAFLVLTEGLGPGKGYRLFRHLRSLWLFRQSFIAI